MKFRTQITQAYLRSRLSYDPESGQFTWLKKIVQSHHADAVWNGKYAGTIAGYRKPTGYWRIAIDNVHYEAHRLAYLYMTGHFPPFQIDHVNMNKSDNRWLNLRACTYSENRYNCVPRADNTSGHKGVCWDKSRNQWLARIGHDGRTAHLGHYDNIMDAIAVRAKATTELHGNFARA